MQNKSKYISNCKRDTDKNIYTKNDYKIQIIQNMLLHHQRIYIYSLQKGKKHHTYIEIGEREMRHKFKFKFDVGSYIYPYIYEEI